MDNGDFALGPGVDIEYGIKYNARCKDHVSCAAAGLQEVTVIGPDTSGVVNNGKFVQICVLLQMTLFCIFTISNDLKIIETH